MRDLFTPEPLLEGRVSCASTAFADYLASETKAPLFLHGECRAVLKSLPSGSVSCCLTSPPYWAKREYANGGLGHESDFTEFVARLLEVAGELHRVLSEDGSFWLNIGDTYVAKRLLGIPWRLAIAMQDTQGWILRNAVIWNKVKGAPDNSADKLRNLYEHVFHFVKIPKGYYYDVGSIRRAPRSAKVVAGAVVSATGVTGVRYRRQIELSTALSDREKQEAQRALGEELSKLARHEIADFRMVIRGQQRVTHSDSDKVSGRAKELRDRGFYFLRYHPDGSKPSDVWEIIPEDAQNRAGHYAPFPEDLCRIPILTTCPPSGVVLDPFCGTGTAMKVARDLARKSVGIDISLEYLQIAQGRCANP